MPKIYAFASLLCLLVLLNGCYRMPSDDDYSLVPLTNNRDVTHEKSSGLTPSVSY